MRKPFLLLLGALLAAIAVAAPLPYDESADAKAAVQQALAAAKESRIPVFVIFGANWCEDCRALDRAIKSGKIAELLAREFKVVKVDIGNFDRNLDLVAAYGNPIKKGIPAAVVLSPDNEVLYATRAGELARDEDVAHVVLVLQVLQQIQDLRLDRDIERRYRLVADEHIRLHREAAGDGDPLSLAAGELMRVLEERNLGEPHLFEQLVDPVAALALARAYAVHLQGL